jgi:hypothetical protein
MHEFPQIPYPFPLLPEETDVDKEGRIWFSRWSIVSFLEYYYTLPEDAKVPLNAGLDLNSLTVSGKPMEKYHSNL